MLKYCKRCLLADIDVDGLYCQVQDLVKAIPEDLKSDDKLYASRLDTCRSCDKLQNGICAECGCFVELRAATKKNYCPSYPSKW